MTFLSTDMLQTWQILSKRYNLSNAYELNAYVEILTKIPFFQILIKISTGIIPTAEKLDLHFHDFTPIIATLCDPTDKKTAWRILSYTQIKLRTLQEHFIMDKVPISLPLYWSKEYSAISVSKILCKLDRMALPPFALADSSAALFNLVVRVFEDTLHIKFGNPTDVKCRVLECKKDRTKFTEALLYSLNKDDEWFLPDRYSGMQFCILKIPTLTKQTKLNSLQFGL